MQRSSNARMSMVRIRHRPYGRRNPDSQKEVEICFRTRQGEVRNVQDCPLTSEGLDVARPAPGPARR
jgi:hypothetical protein